MSSVLNKQIAEKLDEMAELLEVQGANPFRVRAYRRAAAALGELDRDLEDIAESEGMDGLVSLPTVGKGIAAAVWEMVHTGRWSQLERLRGSLQPENLLQTVPGVGPALAKRIHDDLHVDTLEELETAAYDGRLEGLPGIGPRKLQALRATLATMLGRARRPPGHVGTDGPTVAALLKIDRDYRKGAAENSLPKIAPKRFNPKAEAWLPILHADRDGWHFTALFSNTARAHELNKVYDWVVLYFYNEDHEEGQHTVVTETHGPLQGQRVVRGRESECRGFYAAAVDRPDRESHA
jgi:putative hydrolase